MAATTYAPSAVAREYPPPLASAVAWGAIVAGAAGAAALSLILLVLGTGLGLSAVSPWSREGISAETFGVSAIAWIMFTQLAASGMGGYLAGRLRTRWSAVQADEVYFRDTAHGFLAWAIASLATAALLTSAIGSIVGGGAQAVASTGGAAATTAAAGAAGAGVAAAGAAQQRSGQAGPGAEAGPLGYSVDALFRRDAPGAAPAAAAAPGATPAAAPMTMGDFAAATPVPSAEVGRIFANALRTGSLPPEDSRYLGQVVAQRTGLPQADAEKRVTDGFTRLQTRVREAEAATKEAADKARKASSYASLWLFISLLAGAFVAALAATFGGRQRDADPLPT